NPGTNEPPLVMPGPPPDPGPPGPPMQVIYPVPVYTGIVVLNPPEHPDYSRRNPNSPSKKSSGNSSSGTPAATPPTTRPTPANVGGLPTTRPINITPPPQPGQPGAPTKPVTPLPTTTITTPPTTTP